MANGATIGTGYVQIVPSAQGIKGSVENLYGGEVDKAGQNLGTNLGKSIKTAVIAAGIGAAIVKSLSAGGELQQALGGVETMFGESADKVVKNADAAFRTAGISANDYLTQVTSFSATLLQGLEGDTEAAVEYADMAIVDMSDNANKFGTDISSIQSAYQGFARDNYTMLDNLKLGYGGTAEEMARLINDTEVLGDGVTVTAQTVKDVPFDKIIEAIHTVQEDLGVTGTTSQEAAETFSGSMAAMKSSLENVFANASLGRDMQPALEGLAESVQDFFLNNLFPMIKNLVDSLPQTLAVLSSVINPMMPDIISGIAMILQSVLTTMIQFIPELISAGLSMAGSIIDALCKVNWGSVALSALDAIKKSFENHPIATTLALSLVGLKISGQSISSIVALLLSKVKSLLINDGGLTPMGSGVKTMVQLAIGFALAYDGISNFSEALETEGIADDLMRALEGAAGGALVGFKIGGPLGATIGATLVLGIDLIIAISKSQDDYQAECSAAFALVKDEWVETGKISAEQAAVLEAAFASSRRSTRHLAETAYNDLLDVQNMNETTARKIAMDIEQMAADLGMTVTDTSGNTTSIVDQANKAIYGSISGLNAPINQSTGQLADQTKKNFSGMSSGVTSTLNELSGGAGTIAKGLKDKFLGVMDELPGGTSTAMANTLGEVSGSQTNAIKYSGELGQAIVGNIESNTGKLSINMKETMSQMLGVVNGQQEASKLAGVSVGQAIVDGFQSAIKVIPGMMSSALSSTADTASAWLQYLQSLFSNTSFRFQQYIPTPHFYMSGSFDAQSGSVPYVGVDWYAKAAEYGALFDSPQIIGVGDASQPELLIGEDKLREIVGTGQVTINVYPQKGQSEEAIATMVMRKMQHEVNKRGAAFA